MDIGPLKGLSDSQGEGGYDHPLPEEQDTSGRWGFWLATLVIVFMFIAITKGS